MEIPKLNSRDIRNAIRAIEKLELESASEKSIDGLLTDLLRGYQSTAPKYSESVDVYRARICEKPENVSEISYPPAEYVNSYGRGNKIGQSMFYCAAHRNVPFFELNCNPGDHIVMSKWRTSPGLILNHIGYTSETQETLSSNREIGKLYGFVKDTNDHGELNKMVHEYLGFLFSEPFDQNEEHTKYKLTSILAKKMMHSDIILGLMYPTIQMAGNADNILLKPEYVDNHLSLVNIEYIRINSREGFKFNVDVIDSATKVEDTGEILWSGRPL